MVDTVLPEATIGRDDMSSSSVPYPRSTSCARMGAADAICNLPANTFTIASAVAEPAIVHAMVEEPDPKPLHCSVVNDLGTPSAVDRLRPLLARLLPMMVVVGLRLK